MRTKDIKRWAFDEEISLVEIARAAGVSKSLVSKVIRGDRSHGEKAKRVVETLKDRGCPVDFLGEEAA